MKALPSIILLTVLSFFLISADVGEKIIGEWKVTKIVDYDSKRTSTEENISLQFKADGILLFKSGDRQPMKGKWSYDPDEKVLYISDRHNRQDDAKIKKLTKNKMVIDVEEKGTLYLVRIN
ncbi:MAG: hypothetical protein ACI865_003048 [Flavobacteriaceae bacterium]|jgi:hypothetical protein